METKYGEFSDNQINILKRQFQKSIFFMLLYVDPKTRDNYPNINIDLAFSNLQKRLSGANEVLCYPTNLIDVITLIESAWQEYHSENFSFHIYRKLILDAGSEVMKINGGDAND